MLVQENLYLTRSATDGQGGQQFLYKVNQYGISAISRPQEEISQIHWDVEVIKYHETKTIKFDICHDTQLAEKTLTFYNDTSLNEFLEKAFEYFNELSTLNDMIAKNE
ncbi:MAG TPA: hypothetical protein QGI40_00205 [Nitrospinaceae bacterium]|jgi:hypothetical protein|nr:hypothetical protein [Nitrospinaceae bacterium]MDP6477496.1 hypothetical protein [Nitrospinaceae bacterium]MDP6711367.1 hypothetical protein [Nitrospinaceae bacterium]MDP7058582.1 hypothetical protein [Nitrospinaceae bacterium]MDP7108526.1 hypothetical protein [Nitrospinaceae bacterium]|tara:strand:+ start:3627 stop:3950 length:324 start_codon:yes stop_codon:yes gene_type:complete